MNVYTTNGFTGYWPVGTSAVVVAENATEAAAALNARLKDLNLPGDADPNAMLAVDVTKAQVIILNDGNY